MLENHMVLPSAEPCYDLKPERSEACISCKQVGYFVDGGWFTHTYIDDDEGPYLAGGGDELASAGDTKYGWTCSERCKSQIMYEKAEAYEQKALEAVLDACRAIQDYGPIARDLVDGFMGTLTGEDLIWEAERFMEGALGEGEHPKWANR